MNNEQQVGLVTVLEDVTQRFTLNLKAMINFWQK